MSLRVVVVLPKNPRTHFRFVRGPRRDRAQHLGDGIPASRPVDCKPELFGWNVRHGYTST